MPWRTLSSCPPVMCTRNRSGTSPTRPWRHACSTAARPAARLASWAISRWPAGLASESPDGSGAEPVAYNPLWSQIPRMLSSCCPADESDPRQLLVAMIAVSGARSRRVAIISAGSMLEAAATTRSFGRALSFEIKAQYTSVAQSLVRCCRPRSSPPRFSAAAATSKRKLLSWRLNAGCCAWTLVCRRIVPLSTMTEWLLKVSSRCLLTVGSSCCRAAARGAAPASTIAK